MSPSVTIASSLSRAFLSFFPLHLILASGFFLPLSPSYGHVLLLRNGPSLQTLCHSLPPVKPSFPGLPALQFGITINSLSPLSTDPQCCVAVPASFYQPTVYFQPSLSSDIYSHHFLSHLQQMAP